MRSLLLSIVCLFCFLTTKAQDNVILMDSLQGIVNKFYENKNIGDYKAAMIDLNRASEIATVLDNDQVYIDLYNLNTILNLEFNKTISPELSLKLARSSFPEPSVYPEGNALTRVLEAYMLSVRKDTVLVEERLEEAERLLSSSDPELLNKNTLQTIDLYRALTYKEIRDFDRAKSFLSRVMKNEHSYEKEYLRVKAYLSMAEIFLEKDNLASAQYQLDNVIQVASDNEYPKILRDAHMISYQLEDGRGNFEQALYHFEQATNIMNKYFNLDVLISQEEAAHENDIAMFSEALEQAEEERKTKDLEVNRSKLTSVLSSALLIIISLLTISLYRNNQIKVKTNELLLKKNKELRVAKEEAELAMKTKSQFLSTVSHELRTPLYAVTGLTHLLLEEDPKESQKEHLKSLKFSGEYLLDFINDILQINKIDANKVAVDHQQFDLRRTMEDVCNSLEQTAKENQNKIEVDIAPQIPRLLIGDPLKLSQIFINLLGNALKFTNNGTVTIQARPIAEDDSSLSIHFEVIDEGIGISKEMQESIFESFSQGSVQINRKYGGTGLGLTIVKSLLSLFNSSINLESELGKGSRFFFDITFEKAPEQAIAEKESKQEVIAAEAENILEGLHVLVVEDNKINQVITKKMLDKKEITCDIANDGYEAIDCVKANNYDLVLMDIHMPGISGLAATERIRTFNTELPIVALTAITLDENTEDFFKAGCTDIITKPFKPETFYGTIAKVIANTRAQV